MMTLYHGGDLSELSYHTASDEADWLDLSTGINPSSYPIDDLPIMVWSRLPGRKLTDQFIEQAVQYYSAPKHDNLLPVAGSQAAIKMIPYLFKRQDVAIMAPTYSEHAPAWRAAGHDVMLVSSLKKIPDHFIVVIVNPNNPDGYMIQGDELLAEAHRRHAAGGWLVIDEAFADVMPEISMASWTRDHNIIILKSFGKFFGLAGLRLGSVIAPALLIEQLHAVIGPWAVSGPALAIGQKALADTDWQDKMRNVLKDRQKDMDHMFNQCGLQPIGQVPLFRLIKTPYAASLFQACIEAKIYVRRFENNPEWLRFGVPDEYKNISRLYDIISRLIVNV